MLYNILARANILIMEVFIMTSIKRRIASFVAAFAMIGSVTVPSVSKYITNDTAIVANAYTQEGNVNFYVYVAPNTTIYKSYSTGSAQVTKTKDILKSHAIRFASTPNGTWYYLSDRYGWVHSSNTSSTVSGLNKRARLKPGTRIRSSYSTNSSIKASISNYDYYSYITVTNVTTNYKGEMWYYSKYDNGWVRSDCIASWA